ncbi:rhodanese-like domain-containing protein [Crenobacter sp. SG2305]|uniref:rhodanese-like domain-containing protein n=1 Tax=Crenobacter oryzisoli TaxID=3056844 RepID=UPI0025AA3720|nr:rhodanese-like domain-containing protein [Crenobacter sp. SG2305]MDN0083709.1 rhodanese-like domain-containing protein [Crenobacter sp. SG2305]
MSGVQEIGAADLAAWLADESRAQPLLLDVREGWEVAIAAIPGSRHMPMNLIPLQMSELPDDVTIVTVCHHGVRSYHAGLFLANAGFEPVLSLKGGVDAWANEVDPTMAHY